MLPIERLKNQGDKLLPPGAEKDRADRDTLWLLPLRRVSGTLFDGYRETRIRMRSRVTALWVPSFAAPIHRIGRRGIVMSLPPDRSVRPQRDVRKNRIMLNHLRRVWVRL